MLTIENIKLSDIKPFPNNAKLHPKEQIRQIKNSIIEYGFNDPIAVSENGEIIEGHGRYIAVRELGYTEIPCIRLSHLTDEQRRAYILAHNKLTMNTGFDTDILIGELDFLKGAGFNTELTGFSMDELEKLFNENNPNEIKEDGYDLTAALEKAAFTFPGDLWTLDGKHRLIVGDSTNTSDVDRLMSGKKANLCVTDIPYGVAYKSTSGLSIANDNLKDEQFYQFLLSAFSNIAASLYDEGSVYVFHADSRGLVTRRAFDDAGLKCAGTCVWVKNSQVLGHADYQYKHESILYGWKKDCKHKFYGDRKQTTVWNFDKPSKNKDHPNAKPIELIALPIKNSSQTNGIVLDLFGGGGAILIASEQLGRICYMSELDPKYASVILRRYAENFGGDNIVCERGGEMLKYIDLVKAVETK